MLQAFGFKGKSPRLASDFVLSDINKHTKIKERFKMQTDQIGQNGEVKVLIVTSLPSTSRLIYMMILGWGHDVHCIPRLFNEYTETATLYLLDELSRQNGTGRPVDVVIAEARLDGHEMGGIVLAENAVRRGYHVPFILMAGDGRLEAETSVWASRAGIECVIPLQPDSTRLRLALDRILRPEFKPGQWAGLPARPILPVPGVH